MPDSRTLLPQHKILIAELCNELAFTADEKATAMATLEDQYQLASEPRPEFDYSQAVGAEAKQKMAAEHMRSLGPIVFRAALKAAIGDPELPEKERSDAKRRQMRAEIKTMIRKMFPKRQRRPMHP
jgi:hypothetical protein